MSFAKHFTLCISFTFVPNIHAHSIYSVLYSQSRTDKHVGANWEFHLTKKNPLTHVKAGDEPSHAGTYLNKVTKETGKHKILK